MHFQRYKAQDLIQFGTRVLIRIGFSQKQAKAAAKVLVEADLRGDHAHGIAGGTGLDDIILKVNDDVKKLGFKRIEIPADHEDYELNKPYETFIIADAKGTLGHYVALDIIPKVIKIAKKFGVGKAYIRNSTHFGDCGIYSEIIANHDLAARVTCTSTQWSKPFIELQGKEHAGSPVNRARYRGVRKRFGTNPLAWSIPYDGGIITIDMASTQRAVSPAIEIGKFNAQALQITQDKEGVFFIGKGDKKKKLSESLHLSLAKSESIEQLRKKLNKFGYDDAINVKSVEKGLLKGPDGEEINYPIAFDKTFKKHFWIATLGGTFFGYKGFGLNMLIELDNVIGGGTTGVIRELDKNEKPQTPERVSQTIEAYAIDVLYPLEVAKIKLGESVKMTKNCGNNLLYLPGQKEQETRDEYLAKGIPMTPDSINKLKNIALEVGVPFC
jgi:LDH2 family malate/lactate/ureidoglycolate dehydrogenase